MTEEEWSRKDVADRIRRLHDACRTVDDGGPWIRLAPAALDEAAARERPGGVLDGWVVAVKDLVAVAGLPLGAGSRVRDGALPEPGDAAVVARLRRAGAVVAGTVALHELAFGVTGVNDQVGFPAHPTLPGHIPGGSSSGSAVAVALDQCDLAVGTDTGGSIRIPAALCGVVGFKPSRGAYPLDGVLPLSPTLDHVGFLARTVDGVAVAHQAITGEDERLAPRVPQRIGVDREALDAADGPVVGAVDGVLRALDAAGCELVDLTWSDAADAAAVMRVSTTILFAEAAATHRELLDDPDRLERLGADVRGRLETGAATGDEELRAARAERVEVEAGVWATLDTVDVVLGPTVPVVAPTIGQARSDASLPQVLVANTRLANVSGVPALSLPVPGRAGPPVGFQLLAASDERALSFGRGIARILRD